MLDITPKKAREYLSRMIRIGVLGKLTVKVGDVEYSSYAFNSIFVNSTRYVNNTLYLLFKPFCDKYFPDWMKEKYEELNSDPNKPTNNDSLFVDETEEDED